MTKIALILMLLSKLMAQAHQKPVPTLINGTETKDYPQVVVISTPLSARSRGQCTATVVGPRVIITASHCVEGGIAKTSAIVGGDKFQFKMTQSPYYHGRAPSGKTDNDIALGFTDKDMPVKPLTVVWQPNVVTMGKRLHVMGYGCVYPRGGGSGSGGNDGILRHGYTTVTGFTTNYDAITSGGSALCQGDSGGPSFRDYIIDDGDVPKEMLVTINSKGDIRSTSYLTRVDDPDSQSFVRSFAKTNSVEICGITNDCK